MFPYIMTYTLPKLTYPLKINGFFKINFPFDTVLFWGHDILSWGLSQDHDHRHHIMKNPTSWRLHDSSASASNWTNLPSLSWMDSYAIWKHPTQKKRRISSWFWCHLFWGHESTNLQVISGLDKNGAPNKRDMWLRVRQQLSSHNVLRWGHKSHQCKTSKAGNTSGVKSVGYLLGLLDIDSTIAYTQSAILIRVLLKDTSPFIRQWIVI